ncbi:MAG: sulfurtransferase-like selenium metabolism protein YedF [Firmicutes bacterium]|nr:sulfurtransferase-like selenium metabolism protein YedF [Bacillota bacterium]
MRQIDGRGLECPRPVILIKKAMEEVNEASILVDNEVARDNVKRFGLNSGCKVTVVENDNGIELFLKKEEKKEESSSEDSIVVLIKSCYFGEGDPKLGNVLMKSFLVSLLESDKKIKSIILMNSGIELSTNNLEAVEVLKAFEAKGAVIYSCGTCLDFYNLKDKLKIGLITNMYSSVEQLVEAGSKVLVI